MEHRVGKHVIHIGDMRTTLAGMAPDSIDACVTDPPYELGFMGRAWDKSGIAFDPETWAAVYRVIRPGGYLLAFGGTRTFHRITVAIEDAGWEVKDCLCWLHGQGFPKHKSLLKPAWEPVILAKKPGPGAINVDACRIEYVSAADLAESEGKNQHTRYANPNSNRDSYSGSMPPRTDYDGSKGRWPSNVCLDEDAAAALDAMSGVSKSTGGQASLGAFRNGDIYGKGRDEREKRDPGYGDTGGASRFFYVAKASREERGPGNTHPTVKPVDLMRWLVRLVTPPGGTVLDPFAGSGSTGLAAEQEGFTFVGVELSEEYAATAARRLEASAPLFLGVS